jgi:hypothetical protein
VVALLVLPSSAALAAPDVLPDLVATAPTNLQYGVDTLADGQDHFLLRFDAVLHNIGPGPLEIRGSIPVNRVMTVSGQRIYRQDGSFHDDNSRHPVIRYETADGHEHWHVQNAARYALWNEAGTAEVGRGAKVGFCLEDVEQVERGAPSDAYSSGPTGYCKAGQPNASSVFEGITRGWQDVYVATLPFQWVDISDIAPGRYRLGEQADPDNIFFESNESDNGPAFASETVTVPGWFASSGTVTVRPPQTTIVLGAQQFGSPGSPIFKIESAPKHGNLGALSGYQVVYTPPSHSRRGIPRAPSRSIRRSAP